ncbi:hypothetical protein O181_085302 [Austropuccinia psidii MF-1]|uniref:Uncharacterized protein n=1 Tax=Austropuccinia psidii MF-1 TaxID=1389203 RepID=A0A9Q3FVT4_9BASI|nr:hypothetical protein [Austropuccinia psidii MF-1]
MPSCRQALTSSLTILPALISLFFGCSVKLAIIGHNTLNLNEHQGCCCGRFNAWASKAAGSVDPNMGAKISAEEQDSILKQLVEALVAIQVSFSIFEMPCLRQVLQ